MRNPEVDRGVVMDTESWPRQSRVVEANHRDGRPRRRIAGSESRSWPGSGMEGGPGVVGGGGHLLSSRPDGPEDVDVPAVDVEGGIEAADDGVPQHSDHLHLISEPEAAHAELYVAELLDIFQPDSFRSENSKAASPRDEGKFSSQTLHRIVLP